jgi:hypothetical protein
VAYCNSLDGLRCNGISHYFIYLEQIEMKKILSALLVTLALCSPIQAAEFQANSQIAVSSTIIAANITPIIIKSKAGTVYSIDAFSNNTTLAYVKLYNVTISSCGSTSGATPYARYIIPYGASSSGGGFNLSNINGDAYYQAIYMCVTGGMTDNDNTAPAANAYIVNVHYK